jgi:hypothetical protein
VVGYNVIKCYGDECYRHRVSALKGEAGRFKNATDYYYHLGKGDGIERS